MSQREPRPRSQARSAERVPRYLQVASALGARIRRGEWPVGGQIPTIEALEAQFDVGRITVRQAIDLLAAEGLVTPIQGKGTFVASVPRDERWLQLATDWRRLIDPIRENVPHGLTVRSSTAPQLEPGDGEPAAAYTFLESVQRRRNEPFAIARVHLASHVYARSPDIFAQKPALGALAEMAGLEIGRAHQTLVIAMADIDTARRLEIALNAPVVEARCVVADASGIAIYVGNITYRGDCVRLNIELIGRDPARPDGGTEERE